MSLQAFDYSVIYIRENGSYLLNHGSYHVPNEGEWAELWQEVHAYAVSHPDVVFPEPEPEPETPEQIIQRYTDAIQQALDAFAHTRQYDGIQSACSYANSTDAQFKLEAEYCISLRDATWRQGYAILNAIQSGSRELPSEEELIAELPIGSAQWPNAN